MPDFGTADMPGSLVVRHTVLSAAIQDLATGAVSLRAEGQYHLRSAVTARARTASMGAEQAFAEATSGAPWLRKV